MKNLDYVYLSVIKAVETLPYDPVIDVIYNVKRPEVKYNDYILLKEEKVNLGNFMLGGTRLQEDSLISVDIRANDRVRVQKYVEAIEEYFKNPGHFDTMNLTNPTDITDYIDIVDVSFNVSYVDVPDGSIYSVGQVVSVGGRVGYVWIINDNRLTVFFGKARYYYTDVVDGVNLSDKRRNMYRIKLIVRVKSVY